MSSLCLWAFVAEIWLGMFVIWGFAHENRFTEFESRVWKKIKKVVRK